MIAVLADKIKLCESFQHEDDDEDDWDGAEREGFEPSVHL